jgi:5-bromo-4-chloroindolyl phosphate hydrolysis protein
MKIRPHVEIVENVRTAIKQIKKQLDENKTSRKSLIKEIVKMKLGIRSREAVCSKMECSGISTDLTRTDLQKLREQLNNLRQNLIGAEIHRAVELAKFRALHAELDRFKTPFDPVKKAEKHGKQNT